MECVLYTLSTWYHNAPYEASAAARTGPYCFPSRPLYRSLWDLQGSFSEQQMGSDSSAFPECSKLSVENPRRAKPSAERKGPWVKPELSLLWGSHPSLPQQHHRQIGESALSPAKFHVPSFASVMRPLWGWGQLREACNRYGLVTMCSVAFICKRHEAPVGMGSVLSSRAAPRSRCPPRAAPRSMQSVEIGDDERYAVAFARSMTSRKMAHRPLSAL